MNEELYVLLLLVLSLCDVVTETSAQGDVIESVRAGGMGIGTMVMLIVILIAVAFCLAMYFAEETSWGCICGIIVVLIVFTILMLCPRGPVYEEVPSENECTFDEVSFFFLLCSRFSKSVFESCYVLARSTGSERNGTCENNFTYICRTMFSCSILDILLLWSLGRIETWRGGLRRIFILEARSVCEKLLR